MKWSKVLTPFLQPLFTVPRSMVDQAVRHQRELKHWMVFANRVGLSHLHLACSDPVAMLTGLNSDANTCEQTLFVLLLAEALFLVTVQSFWFNEFCYC